MGDGWQRRLFSPPHCKWDKAYNDQFDNKTSAFFPHHHSLFFFFWWTVLFFLQEHQLHKKREKSEAGLNDEEAAILREFIMTVIIFMHENSCQALLSWKQRQGARDFWQSPFPCAQKHTALSLLLTRAVNSWKITQTWLYASLHKTLSHLQSEKDTKVLDQEEAGDSEFVPCLEMREENQIEHQ